MMARIPRVPPPAPLSVPAPAGPSPVVVVPPPAESTARAKPIQRTLTPAQFALAEPPKRRRRPETMLEKAAKARVDIDRMNESREWDSATGIHLVALYEFCHREVYGVEPLELGTDAKAWYSASAAAERLVKTYFEGDYGRAVSFVHWIWRREQGREQWRRDNNRDGGRIGWRLQFSASAVSDYRVHAARNGK